MSVTAPHSMMKRLLGLDMFLRKGAECGNDNLRLLGDTGWKGGAVAVVRCERWMSIKRCESLE